MSSHSHWYAIYAGIGPMLTHSQCFMFRGPNTESFSWHLNFSFDGDLTLCMWSKSFRPNQTFGKKKRNMLDFAGFSNGRNVGKNKYTEQLKKRPRWYNPILYEIKYQKYIFVIIYEHCNGYLLFLVSLFEILLFYLPLRLHQKCVPLNLKVARFFRTFREPRRTVISSAHNENQILLLRLASFMSVDTKCDWKVGAGIGNLL